MKAVCPIIVVEIRKGQMPVFQTTKIEITLVYCFGINHNFLVRPTGLEPVSVCLRGKYNSHYTKGAIGWRLGTRTQQHRSSTDYRDYKAPLQPLGPPTLISLWLYYTTILFDLHQLFCTFIVSSHGFSVVIMLDQS